MSGCDCRPGECKVCDGAPHRHVFAIHRHHGWHPRRGRFTRGWHAHFWWPHSHEGGQAPHHEWGDGYARSES